MLSFGSFSFQTKENEQRFFAHQKVEIKIQTKENEQSSKTVLKVFRVLRVFRVGADYADREIYNL